VSTTAGSWMALVFGRLSDQPGRRRLMVTLLRYLLGTGAAAFNWP
jgi:MFS family permease